MPDLTPKTPFRPLVWSDVIYDIQDLLTDIADPVHIVGGAVRDALLGRPVTDLDLATPGHATEIARRIANTFPNGSLFVMDRERDVARAIIETMYGELWVDVARFRGNDPDDLLTDLLDRDFTINAMMVDLKGDLERLIDPLNGQQDLADKLLRRCRAGVIAADPVRALRAVRQSTQLKLRIEPETLAEIRRAVGTLGETTSEERVRDEFFKLLGLARPTAALRVLEALGYLQEVLQLRQAVTSSERQVHLMRVEKLSGLLQGLTPAVGGDLATDFGFGVALSQMNGLRAGLQAHLMHHWPNHRRHTSLLILVALLPGDGPGLDEVPKTLRLSNQEATRVVAVLAARGKALPATDPLAMHRFWHQLGAAGVDVCLLRLGDELASQGVALNQETWLEQVIQVRTLLEAYFHHYEEVVAPPALVDGQGLMQALDIQPGRIVGDLLDVIREAQVMGKVTSREDALAQARAYLDKR